MDDSKRLSSRKRKSGSFKKRSHPQFDSGKHKRQHSSHHYSHMPPQSKPIDTIYRILCPTKKIGSVLGKGGEIVNALRVETRAKIRVVDAIPGAEERVIITFSYVSKEQKGLDDDEDPENLNSFEKDCGDLKPHCPAQHALLKVHDRITADEALGGGVIHDNIETDDVVIARLLVPNNQVGCLIGKGGTVIQKLRRDTGANIRVLPAEHLPPCAMSTDELVQISGMPMVVKKALYEVSTLLHDHPRKENPPLDDIIYFSSQDINNRGPPIPPLPLQENSMWSHQSPGVNAPSQMLCSGKYKNYSSGYGPGSLNGSCFGNDGETVDEFIIRVLCATEKIGVVIGKGGANVRQLEHQTGAHIKVEDTGTDAEERIVVISSKEAPWNTHSPTIEAVLQLLSKVSATSEKGTITMRLLVPSRKVGCLLGQGGDIITEMRRRTRSDIRVYSKDDKPKYASSNEELVQISGSHDVVNEALAEIASRLRARTFRDENAHGSPVPHGPLQGYPSESIPGRGHTPSGLVGSGSSIHYDHPMGSGQVLEHRITQQAHDPWAYPGPPSVTGQAYSGQSALAARGYLGPTTARGHGYPGQSTGARQAYPGPQSWGFLDQPTATDQAYPSTQSCGYPSQRTAGSVSMNDSEEVRIPYSVVPSVLGTGGSNISDIHQLSGARLKLDDRFSGASECAVEMHGSPDQMRWHRFSYRPL